MCTLRWVFVSVLMAALAGPALAATYDVSCLAPPYSGVQSAVDAAKLSPDPFNFIRINGSCVEKVIITSMKNLTIQKHPAAATYAIKSPDLLGSAVINITDSFNIKIWDLTLDGNGVASLVSAGSSQQVELRNVTLTNGGAGLMCTDGSWCRVNMQPGDTAAFSALNSPAVTAYNGARVSFGNTGTTITITDTRGGIDARSASQVMIGGTWSITNQRPNATGISIESAGLTQSSCPPAGNYNQISTAVIGLGVVHGGTALLSCALRIENNKAAVVAMMNASLRLGGAPGEVVIRNNTDSAEPLRPGGVVVSDTSAAILTQVTITGNQIAGVLARNNAMVTVVGSTLTGNLGDGVLVTRRSALYLPIASTWGANTGKDLVCTVQGTGFGNSAGIAKKRMDCRDFEEIP